MNAAGFYQLVDEVALERKRITELAVSWKKRLGRDLALPELEEAVRP